MQDQKTYRAYVRQTIGDGLANIESGRVHSHESIRNEFIAGVREGLKQLNRGEGVPIDQAEKLLASWINEKEAPNSP